MAISTESRETLELKRSFKLLNLSTFFLVFLNRWSDKYKAEASLLSTNATKSNSLSYFRYSIYPNKCLKPIPPHPIKANLLDI